MISRLRHYLEGFVSGFLFAALIAVICLGVFLPDKAITEDCPEGYVMIQERGPAKCVQESDVRGWSYE